MLSSMARFFLVAAALILPIYVQAVQFTNNNFKGIAVGKPFALTWSGDNTPVTIKLMKGDPKALQPVITLATNQAGQAWTWTPRSIPGGTYVLSITQGSEINYSLQFPVTNDPPSLADYKLERKATAGAVSSAGASPMLSPALTAYNHDDAIFVCNFPNGTTIQAAFPPSNSAGMAGQAGLVWLMFVVVLVLYVG